MKNRMSKNEWVKIVKIENREFRITFWYAHYDFFYTSIEEKVARKPTFFNKKDYEYKEIRPQYWIDETKQNPIEIALKEIQQCLTTEKALIETEKMLDEFCR